MGEVEMKSSLAVFGIAFLAPLAALAAGVSVTMGAPGFYGRIEMGGLPDPPQLIFPHPVLIAPVPVGVVAPAPVYLHVPPGHEKHWDKHCASYHACGMPVYFVRESWYNNVYVPAYRDGRVQGGGGGDHGDHGDHGHGHGNGGHGGGHGHGHGHGKK
jgi:hypothetical protein